MASNNELLIRIRADIRQAVDDLRTTEAELNRVGREGKEAGSGLNQAGRGARNAGQGLERTGRGAREAGAGLAASTQAAKTAATAETQVAAATAASRREFDSLKIAAAGAVGIFAGVELTRSLVEANQQLQKIKFTLQAVTGSAAGANKEFDFLSGAAKRLGLDLPTAAAGYARLAASAKEANLPTAALHKGFLGLSEALTVLHAPADEVNRILIQLDQGLSLGRIQMQDLRAISNSIPGTFGLVEEAFKGTGKSLQEMLAHGGIPAQQFFERFTALLHDKYGPAAEEASNGLQASINKLKTTIFETETGSQSTFVASFTDAVQNLNQTLSDPAIQQGIASLFSGLGEAAKYAAELAADVGKVGSGLGILAAKIAGFADPNDRLAVVNKQIEDLRLKLGQLKSAAGDTNPINKFFGAFSKFTGIGNLGAAADKDRQKIKNLERQLADLIALRDHLKAGDSTKPTDLLDLQTQVKRLVQSKSVATDLLKLQRHVQDLIELSGGNNQPQQASEAAAAQKRQALALFDQVAKQKQATQAKKDAATAAKAQAQAEADLTATLDQQVAQQDAARTKILDTIDPSRVTARAVAAARAQADALVKIGELTQAQDDHYVALVAQAHTASTQMSQFAIEAARNIQDSFANFLFDPLHKGFAGLVSGFADALKRLAAEAISARILSGLLGAQFSQTGQIGKNSVAASLFHTGGEVGASTPPTRAISPLVFLDAPRYHSGGIAGLAPDEVPAILQRGERITPRGAGAGTVVEVNNYSGQQAQTQRSRTSDGRELVRVVIGQVAGDIRRGGPTAQAIQSTYGVQRAGVNRG